MDCRDWAEGRPVGRGIRDTPAPSPNSVQKLAHLPPLDRTPCRNWRTFRNFLHPQHVRATPGRIASPRKSFRSSTSGLARGAGSYSASETTAPRVELGNEGLHPGEAAEGAGKSKSLASLTYQRFIAQPSRRRLSRGHCTLRARRRFSWSAHHFVAGSHSGPSLGYASRSLIVMADVFISFSSSDAKRVQRIHARLIERGFDVWWMRDPLPGDSPIKMVSHEPAAARNVLLARSRSAEESPYVEGEIMHAFGARKLLPVPSRSGPGRHSCQRAVRRHDGGRRRGGGVATD